MLVADITAALDVRPSNSAVSWPIWGEADAGDQHPAEARALTSLARCPTGDLPRGRQPTRADYIHHPRIRPVSAGTG